MLTSSNIAFGDQLGAQMGTLAEMYFLAKENNQQLVFYREMRNFRRRFLVDETFDLGDKISWIGSDHVWWVNLYTRQFLKNDGPLHNFDRMYKNRLLYILDQILIRGVMLKHRNFVPLNDMRGGRHCDSRLLTLTDGDYDIRSGFGGGAGLGKVYE